MLLCLANVQTIACMEGVIALGREEAKVFTPKEGAEKFTFQAEVNRLMDIIIHSLYSNKVCGSRHALVHLAACISTWACPLSCCG